GEAARGALRSSAMPDLYVLDTNVYVEALRNRERLDLLRRFLLRAGTRVRLDGVVAMELASGGITPAHADAVRALVAPYQQSGRTTAPSFAACAEAGRAIAELGRAAGGKRRVTRPSLTRDALLAASCREAGAVLVTNNTADFLTLRAYLRGFRFVEPWPLVATR
ncbi:MAG: type II toxin-antitoxin system VapC family toxin, partial [Gemmatimonadaceae bacterium]